MTHFELKLPQHQIDHLRSYDTPFMEAIFEAKGISSTTRRQQSFNTLQPRIACLLNSVINNRFNDQKIHSRTYTNWFGDRYTKIIDVMNDFNMIDRANGLFGYITKSYAEPSEGKLARSKTMNCPVQAYAAERESFYVTAKAYHNYFNKIRYVNQSDREDYIQALTGMTISETLTDEKVKQHLEGKDDEYIKTALAAINQIRKGDFNFITKGFHNRVYSNITSLPKSFRQYLTNDLGQSFKEVDISGCQFASIKFLMKESGYNKILDANTCRLINASERGKQYEVILSEMRSLNVPNVFSRDELKKVHMRWFNTKSSQIYHYDEDQDVKMYDKIMKTSFPSLRKFKDYVMTDEYINHFYNAYEQEFGNMKPTNHFFHTFTIVEKTIIKAVVDELSSEGKNVYTVHDCVGVPENEAEKAEQIMKRVAKQKFGIKIHVK